MKVLLVLLMCTLTMCTKKQHIIKTKPVNYSTTNYTVQEPVKKQIAPVEEVKKPIMKTILFTFDSEIIKSSQKEKLYDIVMHLRNQPGKEIVLIGGACEIGTEEYNYRLGLRRGNSVLKYLKKYLSNEIVITSVGESEPVSNILLLNRRCEIEVR